jgi:hypothetical protein
VAILRGFDIANHFVEWSYDYATKVSKIVQFKISKVLIFVCFYFFSLIQEFPYFQKDGSKYPSREQMTR